VLKQYAMKTYRGAEVKLHAFLTSVLGGGEWSFHAPATYPQGQKPNNPQERRPGRIRTGRAESNGGHIRWTTPAHEEIKLQEWH
jgi:hypothetical protein